MAIWFRRCATFEEEAEADREYWRQFSADERLALVDDLRRDWTRMSNDPPPSRDFAEFLACLRRHEVRALVVGAHALAVHAKPRFTKDLDVFIDASLENATRLVAALDDFGFGTLGITAEEMSRPGEVVQLGFPPNRIDVMTRIDGVTFEEAWPHRVEATYAGEPAFFIGREDLIRNKEACARPQDLADADLLRRF